MIYPNGEYYVRVKHERYSIHPIYDILLGERGEP